MAGGGTFGAGIDGFKADNKFGAFLAEGFGIGKSAAWVGEAAHAASPSTWVEDLATTSHSQRAAVSRPTTAASTNIHKEVSGCKPAGGCKALTSTKQHTLCH